MSVSAWLSSSDLIAFQPHGFCYQWNAALIWLHVVSDMLIALAYFSIPIALIQFVRKRRDIPFGAMFVCFGIFITACGATHLMEIWTLWVPSYWFSGAVKVVTALASVPTAVFLFQIMPLALRIPSPQEMATANEQLRLQAATLRQSEERFRQMAENIREIFWTMNPRTKAATYVSPAFEQICELPVESLYADPTSYRELIHFDDRQRVLAALEKLETADRFDEEFRIVCPSGAVKWLRGIGFKAKDSKGLVTTFVGSAQEITAKKEIEFALRKSEDLFRDLVEHSSDLICTHSLDGRLLHVNELPAKLLGYSREEMLSKPMREFLLPDARVQFEQSLITIQKQGFAKGSMVVLTKTGERRIWEYHNTLRTEGIDTPIVRGIAHDVTEQKRVEKALQLSEEKFSKAFLASPYAIVISRIDDGRLIDVNDSFVRISKFRREESVGRTSVDLRLWTNPGDRNAILSEIRHKGRVRSREIYFQTKEGQQLVVNYSAEVIEFGNSKCLLSVCEDITQRKRAEEKLQQAQERIESILSSVADMHILLDSSWHFLYANDVAIRAMGLPREDILKSTFWERYPDVLGTEFETQFRRAMENRTHAVFEFHLQTADAWWEARLYPAPDGLSVFATEITERKHSERELQRLSGELLRLQDEERRRIARDLHDSTGQDLVGLAMLLGQLRKSTPRDKRTPDKLLSESRAIVGRCIRDVRTLSYLLHPPALDHAGFAEAIREYIAGFSQRSGIKVEVEFSQRIDRFEQNVELILFRVVQESLTNIHRHSGSPRAKIRIDQDSNLRLEIRDFGRGVQSTTSRANEEVPPRVGVGIPSMKERVTMIGGRFSIDSTPGGTTVLVTLPLNNRRMYKVLSVAS